MLSADEEGSLPALEQSGQTDCLAHLVEVEGGNTQAVNHPGKHPVHGTVRNWRSLSPAVWGGGRGGGECGECTCLTCTKTAPLQGHMQRGNSASGRVPASPGAVQGKGVTAQQHSRDNLPHPHLLHPPPCGWRSTKCSGLLPPQNSLQQLHVWEAGRSCKSGVHFNASSLADTSAHQCKGLLVDTHYSK